MQITDVLLFQVHGAYSGPTFPPGDRQAQALDRYPEFNRPHTSTPPATIPHPIHAIYVEIQAGAQLSGLFGPIEMTQAYVIGQTLRPFLLGRDPLATELLLDQMLRLDRHGRSGLF